MLPAACAAGRAPPGATAACYTALVIRPTRAAALLAAPLAALALAAGCGGDDGGEDRAEGLTAAQVLERSADAYRELESFRIAFELAGSADLGPEATRLLGDEIDVSGEGVVRPPDEAAIDATVRVAGLPIQAGLTRAGAQVVLSALGRDIGVDVDPSTLDFLDFRAAYPELTGWVDAPERTEGERIDGTDTVAVSGPVDPQRALAALGPLLGDAAARPGAANAVSGTATIWVGTGDLVPRRINVILRGDAGRIAPGAGALDLSLTADLGEIDSAGEVVLPPAEDRLRPDELGSIIGG